MRLLGALLVVGLGLLVGAPPTSARQEPRPIRVLFVGNSYTYVNDLPKMIAELARAGEQRPFVYERETPGGCSLEKHWKDKKAGKKIAAGKWDLVVLQEQSLRPLTNRERMFEYGRKLDAEVRKQRAKTLLYQTWARKNAPEKQGELSKAYFDLGKELKAGVAPVGDAWALALKDGLVLHSADESHPSKAGTYLAACVFYATIYGTSPVGLPGKVGGLGPADARKLQAIAWQVVRGKK